MTSWVVLTSGVVLTNGGRIDHWVSLTSGVVMTNGVKIDQWVGLTRLAVHDSLQCSIGVCCGCSVGSQLIREDTKAAFWLSMS